MSIVQEQLQVFDNLNRIVQIHKNSRGVIRPHFMLTGPSGSGKSHVIQHLADENEMPFVEINAAQLTKEGTSGNSLSKALAPIAAFGNQCSICFVDEFDKLFISGNSNGSLAHETTTGVQNEFLRVLEAKTTSVFGDYGKYNAMSVERVLFVFAGAFNGQEDVDLDKLREFGLKTEFLGRVGLVYNMKKISLESMLQALADSALLNNYLKLFTKIKKQDVIDCLTPHLARYHERNTLGIRLINTLLHQFFIGGGKLPEVIADSSAFQTVMEME